MTEKKRFTSDGWKITYDGEDIGMIRASKLLNELSEENEQLKGEVAHYKLILMSLEEQAKRLSKNYCIGDYK